MEGNQYITPGNGGSSLVTVGLIGVAALVLINSLNGGAPPRVDMNQDDYDFLNNTGPRTLESLVNTDNSPIFYVSQGNQPRTPEQTAALLAALKKRYIDDATVGSISFPVSMFSDAMMALLDIDDNDVRTQTLDIFVKMFSLFSELFLGTVAATAIGVGAITAAAGEAINNANECTEWTWAKKSEYSSTQTSSTNTTISTRSSSTKVLLGLLGSGGSTSTMHNTIRTEQLSETSSVQFIPYCTSTQVNLTAVEAILIAQGAALKSVYDPLRAVISLAPVIPKKKAGGGNRMVQIGLGSDGRAVATAKVESK